MQGLVMRQKRLRISFTASSYSTPKKENGSSSAVVRLTEQNNSKAWGIAIVYRTDVACTFRGLDGIFALCQVCTSAPRPALLIPQLCRIGWLPHQLGWPTIINKPLSRWGIMNTNLSENKERMLRGELYHAFTPDLIAERERCRLACGRFNRADRDLGRRKLTELFREYV